ncbi:MAG: hypothetical protein AB7U45_06270 [Desulfamplus sp.]
MKIRCILITCKIVACLIIGIMACPAQAGNSNTTSNSDETTILGKLSALERRITELETTNNAQKKLIDALQKAKEDQAKQINDIKTNGVSKAKWADASDVSNMIVGRDKNHYFRYLGSALAGGYDVFGLWRIDDGNCYSLVRLATSCKDIEDLKVIINGKFEGYEKGVCKKICK